MQHAVAEDVAALLASEGLGLFQSVAGAPLKGYCKRSYSGYYRDCGMISGFGDQGLGFAVEG